MTAPRRIGLIAAAALLAILIIALGVGLHWSIWIIILGVLVCAGFGAVVYRSVPSAPEPPQQVEYLPPPMPVAPPPIPVQQVRIEGITLPSAVADYEFFFDATVHWRPADEQPVRGRHIRPGARAVDTIINRAAEVAASGDPGTAILLQHRLNDVLGVVSTDPLTGVVTWADEVRVALSDGDSHRLRLLADIRKDTTVWEHQRRFECDKRTYLSGDVLRSTGTALVWWLSRNENEVSTAAGLIGTLAELSDTANDRDRGDRPAGSAAGPRTPAEAFGDFLAAANLDDEQWPFLAAQVAGGVEAAGKATAAEEIRRRFDVIVDEPGSAVNGTHARLDAEDDPDPTDDDDG